MKRINEETSKAKSTRGQKWKFLSSWEADEQQQQQADNDADDIAPQYSLVPVNARASTEQSDVKFNGALTVAAAGRSLEELKRRKMQQQQQQQQQHSPLLLLAPLSTSAPSSSEQESTPASGARGRQIIIIRGPNSPSTAPKAESGSAASAALAEQQQKLMQQKLPFPPPRSKQPESGREIAFGPHPPTVSTAVSFTGHATVASSFMEGYQKQLQRDDKRMEAHKRRAEALSARQAREDHVQRYTTGASGRSTRGTYSLFTHNPPLTTGPLRSISYDKMEMTGGGIMNPLAATNSHRSGGGGGTHNRQVPDPLATITAEQRRTVVKGLEMPMIPRSMIPFLLPRLTYRPPASSVVSKELMRVAVEKPWVPLAQQMVLDSCMQTAEAVAIGPGMKELVIKAPTNNSSGSDENSSGSDADEDERNERRRVRQEQKKRHQQQQQQQQKRHMVRRDSKRDKLFEAEAETEEEVRKRTLNDPSAKISVKEARPAEVDVFQPLESMVELRQLYGSLHPPSEQLRLANGDKCPEEIRQSLVRVKSGAIVPAEMLRPGAEFQPQKHENSSLHLKSNQPLQRMGMDNNSGAKRAAAAAAAASSTTIGTTTSISTTDNPRAATTTTSVLISSGPMSPMEDPKLMPSLRADAVAHINAHDIVATTAESRNNLGSSMNPLGLMSFQHQQQQSQQQQHLLQPEAPDTSDEAIEASAREARLAWLRKQQHDAEIAFGVNQHHRPY